MVEIELLENELYKAYHKLNGCGNFDEIWARIKSNSEILREAVQVTKNKFKERDIVKGLTIAHFMLVDYNDVDLEAYNNLINTIYTNVDIARLVVVGAINGGYSFLLMSLWNHSLELTEEQKAFAVNESMNKIGTVRFKEIEEEYSKKLDDMGVSDENTMYLNHGGVVNPIGEKTGSEYMYAMFSSLSDTQAHGTSEFDIRYQILRNPNWSVEEKKKLVYDFYAENEEYDAALEQWESSIINDIANYVDKMISFWDISDLYECSYEVLLNICENKEFTDRIWKEIQFCKLMHELRPQQWEVDFTSKKKILVLNENKEKIINNIYEKTLD